MDLWLKAPAKLNLTLDVLRHRPDGFHDIASIMVPLGLHDLVGLEKTEDGTLSLTATLPDLPTDENNLALAAARLLQEAGGAGQGGRDGARRGALQGVRIHLEKRIPAAAGLAGGSADAAQVLVGLNRLWGLGLGQTELMDLGARLGSDVPFCILSSTALAEGRGERLTELPPVPPIPLVLLKLAVPKSTGEVYRSLRLGTLSPQQRPDQDRVLRGINERDPAAIAGGLGNVLESVMFERFPQLAELRQDMLDLGAIGAGMSGSGPTLFALTRSPEDAQRIAEALDRRVGSDGLKDQAATNGTAPWIAVTHMGPPEPLSATYYAG